MKLLTILATNLAPSSLFLLFLLQFLCQYAKSFSTGMGMTPQASSSAMVQLSLSKPWNKQVYQSLEIALQSIVDSSDFLQEICIAKDNDNYWQWSCAVPPFDSRVRLTHKKVSDGRYNVEDEVGEEVLILSLDDNGSESMQHDFGWVCLKFYECRHLLEKTGCIDCHTALLRSKVVQHFNELPYCDPGLDAATAEWDALQRRQFENLLPKKDTAKAAVLQRLLEGNKGYIIIDDPVPLSSRGKGKSELEESDSAVLKTTAKCQGMLSDYLEQTSGQGNRVRTDRVHFLSRPEAVKCGIAAQYDLLMGIAAYLNQEQDQQRPKSDCEQPIAPATIHKQLTNPRLIQFAEYGESDFYTAHSDNSLTDEYTKTGDQIRKDFRAYTCILYLNDNGWDVEKDGGALRIYPGSQHFRTPAEAVAHSHLKVGEDAVDISPINGRLLIFDSRLVHSVEKVTSTTGKVRRALTLWINRPNNSGVKGTTFF